MLTFLTDLFKPKAPKAPAITSDTTAPFAIQDVHPFMTRLLNNPRFGLPAEVPNFVSDEMRKISEGDTRRWRIDGDFDGKWVQIEIEALMDDEGVAELTFHSTHAVIVEIDQEINAFVPEMES